MRILSTVMSLAAGGAEILVRNLASALRKSGHTCHLVAITAAEGVGNSREFEIGFKSWLSENGVSFEILNLSGRGDPIRTAARFRVAVKRFRPDLIHHHTAHSLMLQSLAFVRVPTIYTHHNVRLKFPASLFRIFDRFVHAYVSICAPCELTLRKHVRRPVVYIPNGIPENFARGRPRAAPSLNPKVLSVGNLTAQKNYSLIVEAAARAVSHFEKLDRRICFEIAGEGTERGMIQKRIHALGMQRSVTLLGASAAVPQLMAQADLMVNSSHYEGLPIALIEAARSALPVVATNVGGTPEIVQDGETGLLVPAGDPEALAAAIIRVLTDPDLYCGFSSRALALSKRYGLDQCAARHLELYESARRHFDARDLDKSLNA